MFAIQYRQASNVTSLGSFRATIDCLLHRYVLPYRARGRPNVVVFDEDTGLATLAVGSRGTAARRLFSPQAAASCASPCRALGALRMLGGAYAGPLAAYKQRFPGLGPLSGVFVAETDTIARSFMGTFSALAERHGLYLIASGDLPAFKQSRAGADVRLFGDPDLRPRARSAWANPGSWSGPDGNGIEQWQPLSWMGSTYRTVSDPSVHFAYNVTAMMVGNLADLPFDGQSAITQRGGTRGPGCHYVGNSFVPAEDQPVLRGYAGAKRDFVALAPWVVPDGPRPALRRVGAELASGSGSRRQDDYLQTALVADLPLPVDRHRRGCA